MGESGSYLELVLLECNHYPLSTSNQESKKDKANAGNPYSSQMNHCDFPLLPFLLFICPLSLPTNTLFFFFPTNTLKKIIYLSVLGLVAAHRIFHCGMRAQ